MKILILMLTLISSLAEANYDKCKWADATVEFVGSNWSLTPQNFYAKEGDKICIKFSTVDGPKSLRIQNMPIFCMLIPISPPTKLRWSLEKLVILL